MHTPTEPASGLGDSSYTRMISKTTAIRLSRTPSSLEGAQAASPRAPSCASSTPGWRGKREPSLHTCKAHRHRALHPLPAFPGASGSRARGAWGAHQAALASEELPQQPEVAEAKPQSLSQAAGEDRWHQKQCPELTQSKLPAAA